MELMDIYNPIVEQLRATNGKLLQRVAELENERDGLLEANRIACEDLVERHNRIAELRQQRDELMAVVEMAYKVASEHDDRLPFDWAVYCEMLYQAIASVKEKQNAAD